MNTPAQTTLQRQKQIVWEYDAEELVLAVEAQLECWEESE